MAASYLLRPPFAAAPDSYPATDQQRPWTPVTVGTSVLGVAFNGGVMLAADNLISYGSLARFRGCPRVVKVNNEILLAGSGDYADFQYMQRMINQKIITDEILDDGFAMKPKALHDWLTRVLYSRRSQFDPLWNTFVVGGVDKGKPYLGYVDKIGTSFKETVCASGFGAHIALPLMREATKGNPLPTKEAAQALLVKCMRMLYYRDARAFPMFTLATCTDAGVEISDSIELDANWDVAHFVRPAA